MYSTVPGDIQYSTCICTVQYRKMLHYITVYYLEMYSTVPGDVQYITWRCTVQYLVMYTTAPGDVQGQAGHVGTKGHLDKQACLYLSSYNSEDRSSVESYWM